MIIIGLTGGIAMGKTTVASQFEALGVPVLDSDKVVHALLAQDKRTIDLVRKQLPAAYVGGQIDRMALGKAVFGKPEALRELEALLHPAVRRAQQAFIRRQRTLGKHIVLLDIPLLFETDAQKRCDITVAVSTPDFLQAQRALRRSGMTQEKLKHIRLRQLPDAQKRKRADFVVLTGIGKKESLRQVKKILAALHKKQTCAK